MSGDAGRGQGHVHEHSHDGPGSHDHGHHDPSTGPSSQPVPPARPGSLRIEHLHHVYPDGTEALRGIDLVVECGEKVAIVGPNGAGKSTLLLHLNGILEPSHGHVSIGGVVVDRSSARAVRAQVGLVFQDPDDQLFSPSVGDDVAFGPIHMGVPTGELHERVERALAAVGMSGTERRVPHHLSIGQRRRVSLATVLSMDPAVLVFDEPTAGLDPRGRRELMALLAARSETLLVSTHDMALVAEVFPRTVILDEGRLVADAATEVILADEPLLAAHGLERPCG
ncbi:ABC transporter ATP-binding protein [soil metagenome]